MGIIRTSEKLKIYEVFIYLTAIVSTMPIFKVFGITAFTWSIYILLFILFILNKGIYSPKKQLYTYVLLSQILTTIFCMQSDIGSEWKNKSLISLINFAVIFIVFLMCLALQDKKYLKYFFRGTYISCWIQAIWCILQKISFDYLNINLNNLVFNQILHIPIETDTYKNGAVFYPGLAWNPSNLAPVVVIGYLMSSKFVSKLIFVFIALFSGSSTAIIGILVCIGIESIQIIAKIQKKRKLISYEIIIKLIIICIVVCIFIFINSNFIEVLSDKWGLFINRINNFQYEGSGATHSRYYTELSYVLHNSSIIQVLFGYGLSTSGYPFSVLFNQYVGECWVVESDIVNIILSNGVIGFLLYYIWLIGIMIKGYKIDKKYFVFFLAIIIQGITYNVQFNWLLIFEMFALVSIIKGENLFTLDY